MYTSYITVQQEILMKENFDKFDEFLVTSIFNSSNTSWTNITLLESKHLSKFNLSMLENCEFVKFFFHQNFLSYGNRNLHAFILTIIVNFLFVATYEVPLWVRDV